MSAELLRHTAYTEQFLPTRWLTAAERALINKYIELDLEFIPHSTLDEDKAAIQQVISAHRPNSAVLLFEGVDAEIQTNSANTPSPEIKPFEIGAFEYGRAFARAQGFQTFWADMSRDQWGAWQRLQRATGAEELPLKEDILSELLNINFKHLDFFEAIAVYAASMQQTNMRRKGHLILREGAFHDTREQIAVNTVVDLALEIATWHHNHNINRTTTLLLFYGPDHQESIEARLRKLELPYRSTNHLGGQRRGTGWNASSITGLTAYDFSKLFFSYHTYDGEKDYELHGRSIWKHVDARSISDLSDIYEIFRTYIISQEPSRCAERLARLLFTYPGSQEGL